MNVGADPRGQVDDASVVRSEEVVNLGVTTVVSGRVRVRKRVVTETVTHTVEVQREELVVEHDDTAGGADPSAAEPAEAGFAFADTDLEIVLHEERVLIVKQVVPVERVWVRTRVVTEDRAVSVEVAREQVDVVTEPTVTR